MLPGPEWTALFTCYSARFHKGYFPDSLIVGCGGACKTEVGVYSSASRRLGVEAYPRVATGVSGVRSLEYLRAVDVRRDGVSNEGRLDRIAIVNARAPRSEIGNIGEVPEGTVPAHDCHVL